MKKIFNLSLPIGMLVLFFVLFHAPERASGASKSVPIDVEEQNGTEQIGPPWFDEAWQYRQPIHINSNASLPWYQVLVTLNSSNFNFSRANLDGSDVRFTHSDGTTELNYWIESWNSVTQWAYIWVKVPAVANGDTTTYLYYNNPTASAQSNGPSTFDSFDDNWSQFIGGGINMVEETHRLESSKVVENLFTWSVIRETPEVSPPGFLNLADGTGIKSTSTYQYQAVGFRANFGSGTGHIGTGHEWGGFNIGDIGKGTVIGDLFSDESNLFLENYNSAENDTLVPRIGDIDWHNAYHIYEVRWKSGWSEADIDHGASFASSTAQVPSTPLQVTFYSYQGSKAALKVDWVYVRQYRNPEPTAALGAEQGLVDLGINMVDSPDPVRPGIQLTYQLTISNTSTIDAPGVIVTDTIPGNVQIGPISSSQGICGTGSVIHCDLGVIPAYSTANITIAVTPVVGGVITNNAVVGSPGYELDLSDNTSEEETLVDSIPPTVYWQKPVQTGQNYVTYGGMVGLEASATDINDQVAWVEFRLWDHIGSSWVSVGIDNTYPYQVQFKSDILAPNQIYQMFVLAADRAGNLSNPTDPLHPSVIYIIRKLLYILELPLIIK
jgi:uncharacterized repeat protein (TIGR01451 family)